jgi:hypothetical protein
MTDHELGPAGDRLANSKTPIYLVHGVMCVHGIPCVTELAISEHALSVDSRACCGSDALFHQIIGSTDETILCYVDALTHSSLDTRRYTV